MDLFDDQREPSREDLGPGAVVLRGFALPWEAELLLDLEHVTAAAPFRHMVTPGGFRMSAGMTNCGALGWVADRKGYRYDPTDPETGKNWPEMPRSFAELAKSAAAEAGFPSFLPDACLINRYEPGAKLTLHQDKNEVDFHHPIVSVSLGIPAVFLFGNEERGGKTRRIQVVHGDVVVWGGSARLFYHGILPLKENFHPLMGRFRLNLTFRKAA